MDDPVAPALLADVARGDVALLQWEAFKRDWARQTADMSPEEREQAKRELLRELGIF